MPARLSNYEPRLLDDACLAGRIGWARLKPPPDGTEVGRLLTASGHTVLCIWRSMSVVNPASALTTITRHVSPRGARLHRATL